MGTFCPDSLQYRSDVVVPHFSALLIFINYNLKTLDRGTEATDKIYSSLSFIQDKEDLDFIKLNWDVQTNQQRNGKKSMKMILLPKRQS